jgi:predicted ribosomally synthesized peptide with nif11-like leader
MSNQNIEAFLEKVEGSPELLVRIAEVHRAAAQATAEGMAALATELGVPFTAAEFLEAGSALEKEIAESEMAEVAGGLSLPGFTSPKVIDFSRVDDDAPATKAPLRLKVFRGHLRPV